MLAIPEIKEIWETIRRNKESFQRQINQWITDATKAISDFAKDYDKYLFSQDDGTHVLIQHVIIRRI